MKKAGLLLLSAVFVTGCGGSGSGGGDVKLDNDDQKASYAIGFKTGEQMKGQMQDLDLDAFIAGMRDGVGGEGKPKIKPEKMQKIIRDFQKRKMEERQKEREKAGKENAKKSEEFLKENAKKEGVKTMDNGLQYKVLESGKEGAESPDKNDTVKAHYHGTLIDGTVFDSSRERDKPATFPLNRVIEAWQVALPKMKVGDKWKLFVPPELGYGEQGAGSKIGPNEALIFEVELLDVQESEGKDSGGESSSSE
jgi:FKBP-type peptidyl-prolyl cis-trans isomerase FklB